jgi:methyl-accepting chemotaxis protein
VRTLTQRTASAAHEIDELITRARVTIEQGALLCADAGSAMDGVVAAGAKCSGLTKT